MKDQPPERNRLSGSPLRRLEANIAIVMGSALTALFLLGQKNSEFAHHLGQTTMLPATGWYPVLGVLAIIVLNGIFVAGETAVELLKSVHVKFAREHEPKDADRLQSILDRKSKYVAACTL